jgi:molecular chaperone GrpE
MKSRKKETEAPTAEPEATEGAPAEAPEANGQESTIAGEEEENEAPAAPETEEAAELLVPDEVAALNNRLVRLQADFDNFRKRTLRERNELYQRANEDLMLEMLSVLDHLDLALEAADQHSENAAVTQGFRMVSDQLRGVLGRFGLAPVDAEGQEFDPQVHEAVSHLPSPDVKENHVMVQVRRGYMLGDRLLRATQVVVSSGAQDKTDAPADGQAGVEAGPGNGAEDASN